MKQWITFSFSNKPEDSIQNPIIMNLSVAGPFPPSQFDGISHTIMVN